MAKDQLFDVKPLPPFSGAKSVIREALPNLTPRQRVLVSEVAPRRKVKAGGQWVKWRPDVAPYMTEPMDITTSRRFDSVAFIGPARSSKSEGLVLNPLVHAILAQPRVVSVFSPKKDAAKEWSEGALDPLILNSDDLRDRLLSGKGGNNTFGKKFRGGCRLTVDWPVAQKLAQRSIGLCIGTDYDLFDDDIGGDGEAFPLMRKRTEDAGSRAMTIIESSPRKLITDENWTPDTAHEAPPCGGILSIYNSGSRGRLYWDCRECGDRFEPRWDRLDFPKEGSPEERGAATFMACPHCGGVIEARQKSEFNRSAYWLHEETDGTLVPIADLQRPTATASYWLHGPAAALASWSRIVSRKLDAELRYKNTGDEKALKTVTNVELGLPYLPRAMSLSTALSKDALKEAASDHAWKEAPRGTLFLTAAIDVQGGRFVVQIEAWLRDLERVVIDRYDVMDPPEGAPSTQSKRVIDPGKYAEDWLALMPIFEASYPVTGEGYGLKILAAVCDLRGQPGVTPNARSFYRRVRMVHRNRFYLVQGDGGDNRKRAVLRVPETSHRGKAHVARDVPAIYAGVDRLKDEVAASLTRDVGGARKLHISRFAPDDVFAEYAAERRTDKGWRKRPGILRNEALDLSVYALALVIVLEVEALNFDAPPSWAKPNSDNLMAITLEGVVSDDGEVAVKIPPATPKRFAVKKSKRKW